VELADDPVEVVVSVVAELVSADAAALVVSEVVADCSALVVDWLVDDDVVESDGVGSAAVVLLVVVAGGSVVVAEELVVVDGGWVVVVLDEEPDVVLVVGVPVEVLVPLEVLVPVEVLVPLEVLVLVGGRVVVLVPEEVGRVVVGVELLLEPSIALVDPALLPDGIGTSPSSTVCTMRPLWSITKWGTTAYGMLSAADAGKPR
jgi:hypothetical protein